MQAKVFWMYLKLAVWPSPLSIHYSMPYLQFVDAWPWILGTAIFAAFSLLLFWQRSAIGFVGVFVLLILSPTLVVPIITEVAAERRMYLPLTGFIAIAVVGAYWLSSRHKDARSRTLRPIYGPSALLIVASTLLLAIVLSLLSVRRLSAYQTELALWQDEVAHFSSDPMAYTNLGVQLARSQRWKEAVDNYELALRLDPHLAEAHNNLGFAYAQEGRYAEAVEQYQHALEIKPDFSIIRGNLGDAYVQLDQLPEAIEQYNQIYF